MKNVLITGGAGFIGSNLIDHLLQDKNLKITCVDNFDPFYDPTIKKKNIKQHVNDPNYKLVDLDIRNFAKMKENLNDNYDSIIHLAAKVGVKPSIKTPTVYTEVNVNGTQNMLELAQLTHCKKFIYASSSSIYGVNPNFPWSEDDRNILPISPYAATKISGELLGHVYAHLHGFQFIALRLFTVYGPRLRPDLVIHKFAKSILEGRPITMYGNGETKRDYTYIDDIVSGIIAALNYSDSQYKIINLGNNKPVELRKVIAMLEKTLGKKAIVRKLPEQPGDVPVTFADIKKARKLLGYEPKTDIATGLQRFVDWFLSQK